MQTNFFNLIPQELETFHFLLTKKVEINGSKINATYID